MNKNRKTGGFTLIELVIAITIILILAALAIPNYRGHVLRSNRSDAMAALLRIAAAQEKFYMQNNTYTNDQSATGLNTGTTDDNGNYTSANGHYRLTITGANASSFNATATPNPDGAQASDSQCTSFSVNQQGQKSATGSASATCWR